jgi:hypothetical protein
VGASKEDAAVEARALALILAGLAARRVVDTGDIQVRHLHCRCCPAPHKLLALAVTLPRQRRVALAGHPNTVKSLVADLMRGLDAARPN